MPNAHPSLSGRPFARTLSCVLLSLCGAAAAAADSRPAFPTGFLATPHARTSPLAARETITLRNQSVLWQEGTFRTGLDVSLVGTNSLTLRGDLSTETEVRDAFAEILRISGEDNSSLAVSLETASAPTTGGSAPTQLLFDRRAFDDFRGKMFVRAGTYTAVVVADKEFSPDFSQWDPMDGRDFARPTLWVYGSFDVKENVFFTLGNASSDANVAVGGDARLILSGTPSDHGAHLYGSGTVSFDPGALVLVTDETFAQTERDWHVLFGKDLEISGLDNLTVCLPDGSLSGNFVVSGNDVIFTTYKARHTGPLGGFASKLVDAMDDRWMPAALRDFLEDELFATAAYGSDLGPAVEYLATAHLRTGLEEDMVNDASSLAPRLWRTGRAAKPVLPLWVSETDRKAYEKAWKKATPEERKKLRNPADPLGISLWVEVTDATSESETSAHKRPADRRETDRTGFRFAGVWSRGDDAFGAMMRYEDRTTTVGTHYGTEADSTVTGVAFWWQRPIGRGDALLFADWSEASEDLHYSPSSDVYLSARDVNPKLATLGGTLFVACGNGRRLARLRGCGASSDVRLHPRVGGLGRRDRAREDRCENLRESGSGRPLGGRSFPEREVARRLDGLRRSERMGLCGGTAPQGANRSALGYQRALRLVAGKRTRPRARRRKFRRSRRLAQLPLCGVGTLCGRSRRV